MIDWISVTFKDVESEMREPDRGRLFEKYRNTPYDPDEVSAEVRRLYADPAVKRRSGVFEYILGGRFNTKSLEIRLFDDSVKRVVYERQTAKALRKGVSNRPLCAVGNGADKNRVYKLKEPDADRVAAWSGGGATNIANCTALCATHNRAKGVK